MGLDSKRAEFIGGKQDRKCKSQGTTGPKELQIFKEQTTQNNQLSTSQPLCLINILEKVLQNSCQSSQVLLIRSLHSSPPLTLPNTGSWKLKSKQTAVETSCHDSAHTAQYTPSSSNFFCPMRSIPDSILLCDLLDLSLIKPPRGGGGFGLENFKMSSRVGRFFRMIKV